MTGKGGGGPGVSMSAVRIYTGKVLTAVSMIFHDFASKNTDFWSILRGL